MGKDYKCCWCEERFSRRDLERCDSCDELFCGGCLNDAEFCESCSNLLKNYDVI